MTVFIVVDTLYKGGAGRVASLLANSMSERHDVFMFVKEPGINYQIHDNIRYHVLKDKTKYRLFKIVRRVKDLSRYINEYKPHVIYSFGFVSKYSTFAILFSHHNNLKVIVSERSDPNSEPPSSIMKMVRNYSFSKADVLVCQTNMAEEYYKRRIKTKTVVIPNPISSDLPIWKGQNSNKIVTACRLEPQKNIPMLIKAFSKFSKTHDNYDLEVYGDGSLRSSIQKMIEKMNLSNRIHLMGNNTNIHELLSESFMFVLSSDNEGMSNSMLEALAIGVPSVCTDCPIGGAAMVIKDKVNGMLTPIQDVDKFCEAMLWIVENKDKLPDMSMNARKIREIQSVKTITKMWEDLMQ